jgi:Hemolysin activation/secretion protein
VIAINGIDSVRGYRRNIFSTDNGITASIELRLPVLKEQPGNDNKPMGLVFIVGNRFSIPPG